MRNLFVNWLIFFWSFWSTDRVLSSSVFAIQSLSNCLHRLTIVHWLYHCSYSYMIDNIILLITGTLHQRPITELVPKCHPLGSFEEMASINIASTPAELYNAVMIDTPLGWSKHCYFTIKLHFLWQVFPFQWRLAPVKAALNTRPQLFNHWIVLSIRYITIQWIVQLVSLILTH